MLMKVSGPFGAKQTSIRSLTFSELLEKYEVKTIPALKVIKPDGSVLVRDARTEVAERGGDNPEALYEEWESFC